MTNSYLLLGTAKGLVIYRKKKGRWQFDAYHFQGISVSFAIQDPHTGYWWVSLDHKHWGAKIQFSKDRGTTWIELSAPRYPDGSEVQSGTPATLKYIWTIAFGNKKGEIYLGTEPGGLFYSENSGDSFHLVEGLWNHPTRPQHWFGGGRNHAGIHSIVTDALDDDHLYVGISCAGVFETRNKGKSWDVRNQGLRADFLPNPLAEAGHDPHLLLACKASPEVMWQQNHCGIFRSVDGGQQWNDVTDKNELGRYGFALGIDHTDPMKAWVVPADSDAKRIAIDQSLFVLQTEDGGKTWLQQRTGLPQKHCFDIVLRHALDVQGDELVFGTSAGSLFISEDRGHSWQGINHHLPRIFTVKII